MKTLQAIFLISAAVLFAPESKAQFCCPCFTCLSCVDDVTPGMLGSPELVSGAIVKAWNNDKIRAPKAVAPEANELKTWLRRQKDATLREKRRLLF